MIQNHYSKIVTFLVSWDNRLRKRQSLRRSALGLSVGLLMGVILALLSRLLPLFDKVTLLTISSAAGLLGILVALLAVWLGRRPPLEMAREFDSRFGLREQVTTAIELAEGRLQSQSRHLTHNVMQDALETASQVDPTRLRIAFRPRDLLPPAVILAALIAAVLLPNARFDELDERREVQAAIDEQIERLETLRQEIIDDVSLSPADKDEIVEVLTAGIERLDARALGREEAVAELSALENELRQRSDDIERRAADMLVRLAQAGSSFSTDDLSRELSQALQEGNTARASELLNDLLGPQGTPLTARQQEALSNELEQAADQLEEANPELAENLRAASIAVREGNQAAAQQVLQQASQQLSQTGQQINDLQSAGQAADSAAAQLQQGQQAIAQAGQTGQQTAGQNGQGLTDDNAPGSVAARQSAQGQPGEALQQTGSGAAVGSGLGEAQGVEAQSAALTQNNPQRDEEREFESVFAPQLLGGEGEAVQALGGQGEVGDVIVSEGEFIENPFGEAQVPYDQVFANYANAANDALGGEHVPLSMRDLIRDYFSSLDPNQ